MCAESTCSITVIIWSFWKEQTTPTYTCTGCSEVQTYNFRVPQFLKRLNLKWNAQFSFTTSNADKAIQTKYFIGLI